MKIRVPIEKIRAELTKCQVKQRENEFCEEYVTLQLDAINGNSVTLSLQSDDGRKYYREDFPTNIINKLKVDVTIESLAPVVGQKVVELLQDNDYRFLSELDSVRLYGKIKGIGKKTNDVIQNFIDEEKRKVL